MRDDDDPTDNESARGHPVIRWILILVLTAVIVTGGVALFLRGGGDLGHFRTLILVATAAALGVAYLILTVVLGTKRVEKLFGETPSTTKSSSVSWVFILALAVVLVLAILYAT
jgi:hypothetical protein